MFNFTSRAFRLVGSGAAIILTVAQLGMTRLPALAQTTTTCDQVNAGYTCTGPNADSLALDASSITTYSSKLSAENFIATAAFSNPYATSRAKWDYGFLFRRLAAGKDYQIIVVSDGTWHFDYGNTSISKGTIPDGVLDTSTTGYNTLLLVAQGKTSLFFVNSYLVATLNTSQHTDIGDVRAASGFYTSDYLAGASVAFASFSVWSLD